MFVNPAELGEVRSTVTGRLLYKASPKQLAYHNCESIYPLFGGSKGCGKSICLRWDHYLPSLALHAGGGRMHSLILRRKLVDLQRSHLRFVPEEAQAIGAQWKPSDVGAGVLYIPNERTPNHSLIEFGHCQHETDVDQYLSAQYDRMSFDELVTFSENQYLTISSCCRTTVPGLVPRVGGATNPGGKAARWVKRRWIDKDLTDEEDETYNPDDYAYIPALPTDNPFLNWVQYERQLSRLPPELRRAYRDGDWDIFVGQFFPEFRKLARPDASGRLQPPHVQEFAPAPLTIPRYGGLDWGYGTPGVHLWLCFNPEGFLDVEHEYAFNGPRRDKQIAREVAQEIVARTQRVGLTLRRTYGDPSMDEQRGHESGETIMDTFKKHKVPVVRGDNDRINGWARLRAWMRARPDGQPFLRIHPNCEYLIRTLAAVTSDPDRPEDIDTETDDHACDALRYPVMSRQAPESARAPMIYPPGSAGALKQQLAAEGRGRRVLGGHNVRRGAARG